MTMNTEVTREDVEDFMTSAAAAQDLESAVVCAIALGVDDVDVYQMYPRADWSRVGELLYGTFDRPTEEARAFRLATEWVLAARAMED